LKNSSGGRGSLGGPTAWPAFQDVTVVKKPVEHGADGGGIARQFPPVLDRAV